MTESNGSDANHKPSSTVLATDVPRSKPLDFKPCKLCKKGDSSLPDHSISRCPVFPSNSDKVSRILELNGCVRCSSLEHRKPNCITRFDSRCNSCKGSHLGILCEGKAVSKAKTNPSSEGKVVSKGKANSTCKGNVNAPKVKECDNGVAIEMMNEWMVVMTLFYHV